MPLAADVFYESYHGDVTELWDVSSIWRALTGFDRMLNKVLFKQTRFPADNEHAPTLIMAKCSGEF